jgi:hypothetical protein
MQKKHVLSSSDSLNLFTALHGWEKRGNLKYCCHIYVCFVWYLILHCLKTRLYLSDQSISEVVILNGKT